MDKNGHLKVIHALGLNHIFNTMNNVNVEPAVHVFQEVKLNVEIKRPMGEINLQIGSNYIELLPSEVHQIGGIALHRSKLTGQFIVSGTYPKIRLSESDGLTFEAERISHLWHIT